MAKKKNLRDEMYLLLQFLIKPLDAAVEKCQYGEGGGVRRSCDESAAKCTNKRMLRVTVTISMNAAPLLKSAFGLFHVYTRRFHALEFNNVNHRAYNMTVIVKIIPTFILQ